MALSVEVVGINATIRSLATKNKRIGMVVNDAIQNDIGNYMVDEVKASIAGQRSEPKSVDTGAFEASIKKKKKGKMAVSIQDGVPYGKYLEYGTSRIGERRHFRNSLDRNRTTINATILAKLKKSTFLRT